MNSNNCSHPSKVLRTSGEVDTYKCPDCKEIFFDPGKNLSDEQKESFCLHLDLTPIWMTMYRCRGCSMVFTIDVDNGTDVLFEYPLGTCVINAYDEEKRS